MCWANPAWPWGTNRKGTEGGLDVLQKLIYKNVEPFNASRSAKNTLRFFWKHQKFIVQCLESTRRIEWHEVLSLSWVKYDSTVECGPVTVCGPHCLQPWLERASGLLLSHHQHCFDHQKSCTGCLLWEDPPAPLPLLKFYVPPEGLFMSIYIANCATICGASLNPRSEHDIMSTLLNIYIFNDCIFNNWW